MKNATVEKQVLSAGLDQKIEEYIKALDFSPSKAATAVDKSKWVCQDLKDFEVLDDRDTLEHSIRVSVPSSIAGIVHAVSPRQLKVLGMTGMTHDLGKLDPEINKILHNGRAFTPKERKVVNLHAQLGFERLYPQRLHDVVPLKEYLGDFMGAVALGTLFSHANAFSAQCVAPDKKYVDGLVKKHSIPEAVAYFYQLSRSVQITCVADTIDSLLSFGLPERAYQKSGLKSVDELSEEVGKTVHTPAVDIPQVATYAWRYFNHIVQYANVQADELLRAA